MEKTFNTYTKSERLKEIDSLALEIETKQKQLEYFDLKKLKDYKLAQIERLRTRLKAMKIELRKEI